MASAKWQFCRLAFGAAGSAGAQIDTGDAEKVARGLLEYEKIKFVWNLPRELKPKNQVKLLLNMFLVGVATISRGGTITVDPVEGSSGFRISASGVNARLLRRRPNCSSAARASPWMPTAFSLSIPVSWRGIAD